MTCYPLVALVAIDLPTKFELPISSHYEDMEGVEVIQNIQNGVIWGS